MQIELDDGSVVEGPIQNECRPHWLAGKVEPRSYGLGDLTNLVKTGRGEVRQEQLA